MVAQPVIVVARRTAVGTAGHAFATCTAADLAAPVLADVARRVAHLGPVDDVVLGNCLGPGGDIARVSALQAGLGHGVPGVTVDRQCGSGLDAVALASSRIRAGDDTLLLAGGVESASTAPWRYFPPTGGQDPVRYTRAPFTPAGTPDPDMGVAADDLARHLGIDRARQDLYAERSHRLASTTDFSGEIVPVAGVTADERVRSGLTAARLGRLRPAFSADGTATAGNSCGISDGAAVVAVTTADRADGPALRILGWSVAGTDPALPGLAPIPAIEAVLSRCGVAPTDVGIVEITEAFATVALAVVDRLGFDPDIVCPGGGAIALGHPWGASGALLLVRLATQMASTTSPALGLAACAIGGGQGIAMLVERVDR
ncbi:acetyl-CoA acetyltransferase [Rhodococcus sp. Leaf7]|uniref:thiolase family protein n=1 Tax=unclassified Rhodococcus (in: high G+C Gram-positive bacteria) TaxID=192944 RepID=UPI0006F21757|nr:MULTISPECIES: thiolase family protein [unclassified Rhodococcus (in: high G+C Gram-positive bacteria)]KQU06561.1 acetyl-CoA acetyltransferase [Rhodococcus sp. Leaf7]KQU42079.1 acetyl-CoA acetyltransferase [Rhodococcus sp. Leaf247]